MTRKEVEGSAKKVAGATREDVPRQEPGNEEGIARFDTHVSALRIQA
ncbi:MAG: hypothetical protein KGY41_04995 [Desulfovermiculus sp.]|nr:hypothetical protein [Desulfovermiculus sp.]